MLLLGLISILIGYGLIKMLRKEEKELKHNQAISEYLKRETLRNINIDKKIAVGSIISGLYLLFAFVVNIINNCLKL